MSDFGHDIVTGITTGMRRTMFEAYFEQREAASTVAATTHTGTVYMIEIAEGEPEAFEYRGVTYWLRRGNTAINGERYTGGYVGFNLLTGTILVLDENRKRIRRSSSIERLELLAAG
jgi:hypothetical protein